MKKLLFILLLTMICNADLWTRYADFNAETSSNTYLKTIYRAGQVIRANDANKINSEINAISRYLINGWLNTNLQLRLCEIETTQGIYKIRFDYQTYTQALQQIQIDTLSNRIDGALLNPMQFNLNMNDFSILNLSNIYFSADLSNSVMPNIIINDTNINKKITMGYQTNVYGIPGMGIKYNNSQKIYINDQLVTIGNINKQITIDDNAVTFEGTWFMDVSSNRIGNVADPVLDMDAVNLQTLIRAIAENALYVSLLDIDNFDFDKYIIHNDDNYYAITDVVMANPVINTGANIIVSDVALSSFLVENYANSILLSFDDDTSNPNYDTTICGTIAAKTHLINTEYEGICKIESGTNEVSVILRDSFINSDSVVLIVPYKNPEILYNYWYEYVDTNEFKVKTNVVPNQDLEFKWLLPSEINNLISTPNFVFGSGASEVTISAGDTSSALITDSSGANNWGSYTNAICFFVPITATENIYSWYQQRDMENNIGVIKVILDDVQDKDMKFKFVILTKD